MIENAHCDPEQLWSSFWNASLNQITLCQSVFKQVESNTKSNPQKKLIDFLKSREIVIKLADKNAGLTIMKKSWYEEKMNQHIADVETYAIKSHDPKQDILQQLAKFCSKYKSKFWIWYKEGDTKIVAPLIYLMPKIHKTPIGIRPIIPSHSWYTTKAAKYLHRKLFPILKQNYDWVITDRLELIQELELKKFISSTVKLATIDVTALYTSIDLDKGLKLLASLLEKYFRPSEINFYMDLFRWVLSNNYFQFQGKWYQQIKGAAMGGNASGIFADLVLVAIEQHFLTKLSKEQSALMYRRYRDDVLIVVTNIKSAKSITQLLNQCGMLQFNLEQFGDKVNFLDITISLNNKFSITNQLDIQPYRKPTSNKSFVNYATYKPESTKTSWITGEQIRLLRASQTEKCFRKAMLDLKTCLLKADYPRNVIRSRCKYKFADRNWLIEKTQKTDSMWYSLDNSRMAHEKWNFIQNNFKPLLKFHNVQMTARNGRSTMDALNVAAKSVLKAPSDMSDHAAKQLDLVKSREKCHLSRKKKDEKRKHRLELLQNKHITILRPNSTDRGTTAQTRPGSGTPTRNSSKRGRSINVDTAACEKKPQRRRIQTPRRASSTRFLNA